MLSGFVSVWANDTFVFAAKGNTQRLRTVLFSQSICRRRRRETWPQPWRDSCHSTGCANVAALVAESGGSQDHIDIYHDWHSPPRFGLPTRRGKLRARRASSRKPAIIIYSRGCLCHLFSRLSMSIAVSLIVERWNSIDSRVKRRIAGEFQALDSDKSRAI